MTTIDIVGGGLLGLTLGYSLLKRGVGVRIWERSNAVGGSMARATFSELNSLEVDRCYHVIRNSDRNLVSLIDEMGLSGELLAAPTKMGLYHNSKTYPMSSPLDLVRFPPLSIPDRARLAWTIQQARRVKNWRALEQEPVVDWLVRLGGTSTFERFWKPLLHAKFDGSFDDVPATYMWSQLVRAVGTRDTSSAKEQCFLSGGYAMLTEALARAILQHGGEINTGTQVEQVRVYDGRVTGLKLAGGETSSEGAILTLQIPLARRLLPLAAVSVAQQWSKLDKYLGIVCMMLVLRRSLIPYYTLNIADETIPFTSIIETTNLIDRKHTGSYHLVYLPKYVTPSNVFAQMDDEALEKAFMVYLRQMFPDLRENDIAATRIEREYYVEPLHAVGQTEAIAPVTSNIAGLYLVSSAQIYPQLACGEAAVTHAQQQAAYIAQTQARIQNPLEILVAA